MAGAAITNVLSDFGTIDVPYYMGSYFRQNFWDDLKPYADHSPMFHIKNARTFTLILHGLADERVPPEQGFQLHRALQRLGVLT